MLDGLLERTGVPAQEQIDGAFPPAERLALGPVAVFECYQSIPCNPCAMSCPQGAVLPFEDINDRPKLDAGRCNGCGLCIMKCPGLAIMAVDASKGGDEVVLKLPYEFRPLPEAGQVIAALDRAGEPVGEARVISVMQPANKTTVVAVAVSRSLMKTVRNIRVETPPPGIVCRCSDITVDGIRDLIRQGYTSVDEIKRMSRLGMGPCQGRTCIPLALRELARELGVPADSLETATHRPIVTSVKLGDVSRYESEEEAT